MIHLIPPALIMVALIIIVWRDTVEDKRGRIERKDQDLTVDAWLALSEEERAERMQEPFGRVER